MANAVRKRILLVEDDRETAGLLAEELRDDGYEVVLAHDGGAGYNSRRNDRSGH